MSTLDQITGDLEIERGLKPSFTLHFMNEYSIVKFYTMTNEPILWRNLRRLNTHFRESSLSFSTSKLAISSRANFKNLFAIIYISSDYGI